MIVLTRRALAVVAAALVVAALLAAPVTRDPITAALKYVFDPVTVADRALLAQQSVMAEREIQRAYDRGLDQLKRAREFRLPITPAQADAIVARYTAQLQEVRRSGLASLAAAQGLRDAQVTAYLAEAERRLAGGVPADDRSGLLAPTLGAIVTRTVTRIAPLSDAGVRELTVVASPSPSPGR